MKARMDAYVTEMEEREKMMLKLDSIKEIKVTAYHCPTCQYTSEWVPKACRQASHKTDKIVNAIKRFWNCSKCKHRIETLNLIYPKSSCP